MEDSLAPDGMSGMLATRGANGGKGLTKTISGHLARVSTGICGARCVPGVTLLVLFFRFSHVANICPRPVFVHPGHVGWT